MSETRSLARALVAQTLVVTAAAVAVVATTQRRLAWLERALAAKNLTPQQVQATNRMQQLAVVARQRRPKAAEEERRPWRLPNGDLDIEPVDSAGA